MWDVFYDFFGNYWAEFTVVINLALATLCGIGIFGVFYLTNKKLSVNRSFSYALILLPPISAMVAVIVSRNIVLAAGMLGALSIIRFRHSTKEAKNLVFIFWSCTAGIASGLSLRMITAIWFIVIAVLTLLIHFFSRRKRYGTISVKTSGSTESIESVFNEHSVIYDLKYKNTNETSDILYELRYKKGIEKIIDATICNKIMQAEGVSSVRFIEM